MAVPPLAGRRQCLGTVQLGTVRLGTVRLGTGRLSLLVSKVWTDQIGDISHSDGIGEDD